MVDRTLIILVFHIFNGKYIISRKNLKLLQEGPPA
ncbi:hypothetical protein LSGJ_00912 [Ligilactobacillus salivarius GJ-24]|uniref:Uncharacterized protein n=1 Tax=Ligilactobacillus salivarius GJ-24 TaxID=1041521 RepID=F7QUC7_9LACO|nr:hypothetical protein LSGJ_00912 [Ligilactobacillus salivarius GJ-24]